VQISKQRKERKPDSPLSSPDLAIHRVWCGGGRGKAGVETGEVISYQKLAGRNYGSGIETRKVNFSLHGGKNDSTLHSLLAPRPYVDAKANTMAAARQSGKFLMCWQSDYVPFNWKAKMPPPC